MGAEQIEDERSRAQSAQSFDQDFVFGGRVDFDMSSESLALVSISMLPDTRGLSKGAWEERGLEDIGLVAWMVQNHLFVFLRS